MTTSDIMMILGGVGAMLVSLGGAAKWILTYIDGKAKEALESEKTARTQLKDYMDAEIKLLNAEIRVLSGREGLYLKRILQLEAYIQGTKGLEMPRMEGWPPS